MKRSRGTFQVALLTLLAVSATARGGGSPYEYWNDPTSDATLRRTDTGNDGIINATSVLPDIVQVKLGGWNTSSPTTNPYAGSWSGSSSPDLLRLEVTFAGVINPPGPLGLGSQGFDPYLFGPSPVYGFIEFDADRERDTGGECSGATLRYLANVARFGMLPSSSSSYRAAITADDHDWSFNSNPQFERSGQEFALVMCGCFNVTVIETNGDQNATFDAGDTWIIQGRFFQRAGGLMEASAAFGGSVPQAYDPLVNLQFSHSISTNRTTVTLIYPMTMTGAAQLSGQPQQAIDLNVGNHTSVREALEDIIAGADDPTSTCGHELSEDWSSYGLSEALDPSRWRATAIVGTSYEFEEDSLYAWTDVGFEEVFADLNTDTVVDAADLAILDAYIAAYDGGSFDADATIDGCFTLKSFGPNFCLYDLNADGVVNVGDRALLVPAPPAGDVNGDCVVNGADLSVILSNFSTTVSPGTNGDVNDDGLVNGADLSVFLSNFGSAC